MAEAGTTQYRMIRVIIRCQDGSDHTTYLDLSPTTVTLADLLLHALDHDQNTSCGPHYTVVDTVPRPPEEPSGRAADTEGREG